jgi:hypothetical protein
MPKLHLPVAETKIKGGSILQICGYRYKDDVSSLETVPELLSDILQYETAERAGTLIVLPDGRTGRVSKTIRRLAPINHPANITKERFPTGLAVIFVFDDV